MPDVQLLKSPLQVPAVETEAGAAVQRSAGDSASAQALYYLGADVRLIPGNRFQLLRDGAQAYPAMLEAIRSAQKSVRLETYMFIDDAVGEQFGRALAEAAGRGVQVTVLYDALGSHRSSRRFFQNLRDQGVDIRPFKPFSLARGLWHLLRRNHRKVLVVDREVAFVGGVNIASQWAPRGEGEGWRDDVVRVEGPAARTLERAFSASWRMQVRARLLELKRRLQRRAPRRYGKVNAAVLTSRRRIHRAYLRAIERARRSVLISAAYFVPDRKLLSALRAAAERGVEVSLILAGASDHALIKYTGRAYYDRLLSSGVRIFEWYDGVLHAKTAVVDSIFGTVGSFNLERTSLHLNHEVNVFFLDSALATALEDSFRSDCSRCRPILPELWAQRSLWQKAVESLCYLFRKIL